MSNPNTHPQPLAPEWVRLAVLALLGYGVFLAVHFAMVAGGADSSGYLNSARLLTEGHLTTIKRTVPELGAGPWSHFLPLGFIGQDNDPVMAPTYPVGVPILMAIGATIGGWYWGPLVVCVLACVAGVWLCYLCGRELGVGRSASVLAAVALAVSPMYVFSAVQPLSDAMAAVWCTAAVYLALRARRHEAWAAACGLAFSVAVYVRPSNTVLLPALVILLWHWRRLLWAGLAGFPWAVLLGLYQHYLYGSATTSGYGAIWEIIRFEFVLPTVKHYATWMPCLLPLGMLAGPALFFVPWRERGREILGIIAWAVGLFGFYAFYSITQEVWWCHRFVLPGFPPLVLLAVMGCERVWLRFGGGRAWVAPAAVGLLGGATILLAVVWAGRLGVVHSKLYEQDYVKVCAWTREHLPAESIVLCMQSSGAFYFYTDFPIMRWDQVEPDDFARYAKLLREAVRPTYAVLSTVEKPEAMSEHIGAVRWTQVGEAGSFGVWQMEP